MQEQLEFPFVHLAKYGGFGLGLPGPIGQWCNSYGLGILLASTYCDQGKIDSNTVKVGIVSDSECRLRVMMRDFVDYYSQFFSEIEVSLHNGHLSFYYCGLRWQLYFNRNEYSRLAGCSFDIILSNLNNSPMESLKEYLKY